MAPKGKKKKTADTSISQLDLEKLLEKQERLEELMEKKFKKVITVMFTDLQGSTSITESEGDMAVRKLLKKHNDILFPTIKKNRGVLVKTMGDGSMSYFKKAKNALRSAIKIQEAIEKLNREKKTKIPIHIRIGLHTGEGIVEEKDIYGDVVNVASRFESIANPGEIYFSESTYEALGDQEEIHCSFIKTAKLKGKKNEFKVFKALWNPEEIETAKNKKAKIEEESSFDEAGTSSIIITGDMMNFETSSMNIAEKAAKKGPNLVIESLNMRRKTVPIEKDEVILGRSKEADIILEEHFISRRHARVFLMGGCYYIEDLNSKLGVEVNRKKITKGKLNNGDEIRLGSVRVTFAFKPPGASA